MSSCVIRELLISRCLRFSSVSSYWWHHVFISHLWVPVGVIMYSCLICEFLLVTLCLQVSYVSSWWCHHKKQLLIYNAVSSPQDRSKRFTLYFPDRPAVHSDTISASLGSIQPYAAINARRPLVHISITVYSQVHTFIQLSELEQCIVKKLAQVLTPQPGFEPGFS